MDEIKNNNVFNGKKYDTLYEALNINYPNYILALAMSRGKTYLIASIIAIEFAIALDNQHYINDEKCIKNALVFAPGLTIKEQLKRIVNMDYSWVLPERLRRKFLSNITFHTEANINTVMDCFNIVITNTEKLTYKPNKNTKQQTLQMKEVEENFRVQKIQGLKNLAVFSDEAHHVYGNIGDKIKRTRDVLNKISSEGNIKCAINTTGTPYNGKNMLQKTIFWYGLTSGIEDKILKNIEVVDYNLSREDEASVVNNIIKDFFQTYKNTKTQDGAMAKIAFYFKDEKHLQENKAYIQNALMEIKEDLNTVLVNTQQSSKEELIEFANINNPGIHKKSFIVN